MTKRRPIDLRSDTVTRPTPAMYEAMRQAELGDDVYGEDPTVNRLEARVAELLGKEAAVFVPSGTMSNQIAVRIHTQPGDEILLEARSHIYNYEAGGPAVLSGATCRCIEGDGGILTVSQLAGTVRPEGDHFVRTRLVCLENTHNRCGGRVYPLETIGAISRWARDQGLALHLDGARLMNAVVASGVSARAYADHFDTVSMCFSKGLGAPVGSALAGPAELIRKARRTRKVLGGGMRQAGVLAAAALFALEHHVGRLAEDHANAQVLAAAIAETEGLRLNPPVVQTNIIWFEVDPDWGTAAELAARLRAEGVLVGVGGPRTLRACTHLDVDRDDVEAAGRVIRALVPAVA